MTGVIPVEKNYEKQVTKIKKQSVTHECVHAVKKKSYFKQHTNVPTAWHWNLSYHVEHRFQFVMQ